MLGLAAIAGSIANPPERSGRDGTTTTGTRPETAAEPPSEAARADGPTVVRFPAADRPHERAIATGEPAQVVVEVDAPAVVAIPDLGLTESADPLTPAMFDILLSEPGGHEIRLLPADPDGSPSAAGTLTVTPRR